jgi:primosomal protein N' (replication factor Y)
MSEGNETCGLTIARVALDVPVDTLFDYRIEAGQQVAPGDRVRVPLGRRTAVGVVMEIGSEPAVSREKLRPLLEVLQDEARLAPDILALLRFCHRYYHHPIGQVVATALPAAARRAKPLRLEDPPRYFPTLKLMAAGAEVFPPRQVLARRLARRLLDLGCLEVTEARHLSPRWRLAMARLLALGFVECRSEPPKPPQTGNGLPLPPLTPEQGAAANQIHNHLDQYHTWLLHGVTGSGKTQVYLHLIAQVVAGGRQALMLVPEINLTPQLEERVRSTLPSARMITLHSGLPEAERTRHWLLAATGQADVVLGTRLAVFTPLPRLGLLVVDEEHDPSFKQQEGLRYSARDLAILRAHSRNVPVVLGSATPSLESYANAQAGRYRRLTLTRRAHADATLPSVRIVDVRGAADPGDLLSAPLREALAERLARGEQSLIYLNRRGFAPVLYCRACSWTSECRRCATKLVLHTADRRLRCHHCGAEAAPPARCPHCGNADLLPLGHGTQRLEAALRSAFPGIRLLRVDRDSTRRRHAWPAMRRAIHEGAVDVLVGTQMLAKGHDFSRLTLVGIVDPDAALYAADFRASERLFAQLTQVAGRAGRADRAGEVILQTRFPDHPLYKALAAHSYDAFAQATLEERRQTGFPPYAHQALLRAAAHRLEACLAFLGAAAQAAGDAGEAQKGVAVFDPVPAALPRRKGLFQAQLLVQSQSREALQRFLAGWAPRLEHLAARRVRWSLDVDPLEL